MSFFRYPGGKSKIKEIIISEIFKKYNNLEYREPFFGGGSIGINLIKKGINNIWINDKDIGVSCLWNSVINCPKELKELIVNYKPKVEDFYFFKEDLLNKVNSLEILIGFKKLVLHQISYSGLGTKSGGPLGRKQQKSKYKIDCRWSPDSICKKIDSLYNLFSKINIRNKKCYNVDFEELIKDEETKCLIYLDPPYYIKGEQLYQFGFNIEDHKRMCNLLKDTKHEWVLSYDDCDEIRDMYSWAKIQDISINYSINTAREKKELIITGN